MGEERGAYLSVDVVETAEQVNLTLRALLGEYTNYGYLYALSSYASELLGWERFDVADPDGQVFLDTPPLLNLV